ncbi:MAG: CRISPR system precrRNA processing endoribonuclease RAMP protein Cas6 [Myxococcota bacterium]
MPGRLILSLTPQRKGRPSGAVIQAATLEAIRGVAPELAQRLHDHGPAPAYHTALVQKDARWDLHLGLAKDEDIEELVRGWMRRPPRTVRFGDREAGLLGLDASVGIRTWDELMTGRAKHVRLHFRSPTLFRSPSRGDGGPRPIRVFPSPERVLDALRRRWAALAPFPLGDEALPAFASEYDFRGRVVTWGRPHPVSGYVGTVRWNLQGRSQEIAALLRLGTILGVGSRTTRGCGHLEVDWDG